MSAPIGLWVSVFLQDTQHSKDVDEHFTDGPTIRSY